MENDKPQPTAEVVKELEEKIAELQSQLEKNKKAPKPGIEFLIEYATGYVQIRRLMPHALNLPTWVIRWILTNSKQLIEFMSANTHLLIEQTDSDETLAKKLLARTQNLTAPNPVVRKPRAKNEPAGADSD